MSYLKLAHDLVDGVHRGDLRAVVAAVAILSITALSGYATTILTQWGTKKGWQGVKWLITPKPMEGLAKILLEALKNGDRMVYRGDLLVDKRLLFTSKKDYLSGSIHIIEPHVDSPEAKWTKIDQALNRRDLRRLLSLSDWYRDCLSQKIDERSRKHAWAKGMEVAEQIAHPVVPFDKCDPKEYGFPSCQCSPDTGDTCNTCTGEDVIDFPASSPVNGQADKGPFEMRKSNIRYECQCDGCKESRKTKWKRDDV